jgi:hypothetical protein
MGVPAGMPAAGCREGVLTGAAGFDFAEALEGFFVEGFLVEGFLVEGFLVEGFLTAGFFAVLLGVLGLVAMGIGPLRSSQILSGGRDASAERVKERRGDVE